MIEKTYEQIAYLYNSIPSDDEAANERVMKKQQKEMLLVLSEAAKLLSSPEDFVKNLKRVMDKNKASFISFFGEDYVSELINTLLMDLQKKKIIDKAKIEKVKKDLSKIGVEIYI